MATYPTVAPGNSLAAIQQKVRRITRSPSEALLTTDDLNNYINTCVLYDFPEHLRTFQLRQPFTFWCNPLQDTYQLDIQSFGGATNAALQPLYNFQNLYLTLHKPVYVAGYETFYTQDRREFYASYPINNFIQSIGVTGDSSTTRFTGTVQFGGTINNSLNNASLSLLKRNVLFDSVDVNGNGLSLVDVPVLDATTGVETIYGNLYTPGTQPTTPSAPPVGYPLQPPLATAPYISGPQTVNLNNYINYATGQFVITFPVAPLLGQAINSQTVPTIPSRPFAMLYHNNTITLRPVPDQPYAINFEVDARPTQLFQTNSVPQLEELWQYLAYLTAKKIFEDRMDMDSVQAILPELDTQERLSLRRTLVQLANQRSATIY
ncbi:MAG: hypothetical protein ACRDL7_00520, partial [Gaiellaceae bacterium]